MCTYWGKVHLALEDLKKAHDSAEINAADDIIRDDYTDEELKKLVADSLTGIEEGIKQIIESRHKK